MDRIVEASQVLIHPWGLKMKSRIVPIIFFSLILASLDLLAADTVPNDVQQPGTQPGEIGNLESPNKCDNCHGGYNSAVEPAHNWRGSMMAQAGRDPIFWATVAIAEQDFDGVGDLCIRCHSTGGWLAGRSTPTDGSGLTAGDSDGVECDYCHKLTNPDDSEHQGTMNGSFIANEANDDDALFDWDDPDGTEGYYGSGMSSMWGGSDKLGPYDNAEARHQFMLSEFHRDRDFCGTCHDVSNPVTGDLAHNQGTQETADSVVIDGIPGAPVDGKAAFNNPPYRYGVVERTFSEYKSGQISRTLVSEYPNLPEDLQGGVLEAVYMAATEGGTTDGNYQNPPAPRYFSCQTCHMRPVTGTGANKRGVPVRSDLPLHDMTGGNYWMPEVLEYLDAQDKLVLGGGMTADTVAAIRDGANRAREQLNLAASLKISDDGEELKVINHTGHKLISGYPEGRRMWLHIEWLDANGETLREDGKYGPIGLEINGFQIQSILEPHSPDLRIYEAHMGMTQEWAAQLLGLDYDPGLVLMYDRMTGNGITTLGSLAAMPPGSETETFHFALNNTVISDNRIPPYGLDPELARQRNALPVPATLYEEDSGQAYEYYDEISLQDGPDGTVSANVELLYQPTSWEYIQFLWLANKGTDPAVGGNAFLGEEGQNILDAWLNTRMAEPHVMASVSWGAPTGVCDVEVPILDGVTGGDKHTTLDWTADTDEDRLGYYVYYDQSGKAQLVADCTTPDCNTYTDSNLSNGQEYCYKLSAYSASCESAFSNILCATPMPPGHQQTAGVTQWQTGKWIREGKGKNATLTFEQTSSFVQGDAIVLLATVVEDGGLPLAGANVSLAISGPASASLVTTSSDANGIAEVTWNTQKPNKKGAGGTPVGAYTATVTGLSAGATDWNNVATSVDFTLGPQNTARKMHR
jgi:hypothetical protein